MESLDTPKRPMAHLRSLGHRIVGLVRRNEVSASVPVEPVETQPTVSPADQSRREWASRAALAGANPLRPEGAGPTPYRATAPAVPLDVRHPYIVGSGAAAAEQPGPASADSNAPQAAELPDHSAQQ